MFCTPIYAEKNSKSFGTYDEYGDKHFARFMAIKSDLGCLCQNWIQIGYKVEQQY